MPRGDGRGPLGEGSMTGRGKGSCKMAGEGFYGRGRCMQQTDDFVPMRQGRRSQGSGMMGQGRRMMGQGSGMMGQGRRFGRSFDSDQETNFEPGPGRGFKRGFR